MRSIITSTGQWGTRQRWTSCWSTLYRLRTESRRSRRPNKAEKASGKKRDKEAAAKKKIKADRIKKEKDKNQGGSSSVGHVRDSFLKEPPRPVPVTLIREFTTLGAKDCSEEMRMCGSKCTNIDTITF